MRQDVIPGTTATNVLVTGGTGAGTTELTSFDAALQAAGIHDANLIRISSITPAGATTKRSTPSDLVDRIEPGAYYPAVYSWNASDTPGDTVYAAVAGATLEAGYGINVEDHGTDVNEERVRGRCRTMLEEMAERRNTTVDGDIWVHDERRTIEDTDGWGAAVAAMLYTL